MGRLGKCLIPESCPPLPIKADNLEKTSAIDNENGLFAGRRIVSDGVRIRPLDPTDPERARAYTVRPTYLTDAI